MLECRQLSTLCCAAWVVGILLGEFLEIAAVLNLLQQPFSFCLRSIQRLLIDLAVSPKRRSLYQDVAHVHTIRQLVLIGVLVVVLPDVVVAYSDGNARCADSDVARLTLFGN